MPHNSFLNHNVDELMEMRLLQKKECELLNQCGLPDVNSILTFYCEHSSFDSLAGCTKESAEALKAFSENYLNDDRTTTTELFSDAFHSDESFFVPVTIEWNTVSDRNRAFLNTWINFAVNWYTLPPLSDARYSLVFEYEASKTEPGEYAPGEVANYMYSFFGRNIDAETFYKKAIVRLVLIPRSCTKEQEIRKCLFYLRSTFLKFYKATQLLPEPFDLLRFFAKNEFFIDSNHIAYQKIWEEQNKNKEFPFAKAVYEIVSNSSYINRLRGLRDMNMERFVSIFDKSPYTFNDLHYLFGMSQRAYDKLKKDCNAFAENGCRITIAILKALGFKTGYDLNAAGSYAIINYRENLYLPGKFYDLLFEELGEKDLSM